MASTRLISEPFFADIVQDSRDTSLWVYIVQRQGSNAILSLGTCTSQEQAAETAATILAQLTAAEANPS